MTTNQGIIIKDLNLSIYDINHFFGNSNEAQQAVADIQEAITLLSSVAKNNGN